jgi:hypothetical protein
VLGTLERGPLKNQPHVHTLLWLEPRLSEKFVRLALPMWLKVSPGGDVHLERVLDPNESSERLAWYLTKEIDQEAYRDGFFSEADLGLPEFGGAIQTRVKYRRDH